MKKKGENSGEHSLFFFPLPKCFLSCLRKVQSVKATLIFRLQMLNSVRTNMKLMSSGTFNR